MRWAEELKPKHRPKSPLGVALKYMLNQRKTLERFLGDPKIRLDNNIAKQHLRLIALGRKNFLFVGHDEVGRNLATLQTLVSTCFANGVNPQSYLTDVLIRVQDHPHSQLDELIPWNWLRTAEDGLTHHRDIRGERLAEQRGLPDGYCTASGFARLRGSPQDHVA